MNDVLKQRLLGIGGVLVGGHSFYVSELLCRGHVFFNPVVFKTGVYNRCHLNSTEYFLGDVENRLVCTGFFLCDGFWLPHSWVLEDGVIVDFSGKLEDMFLRFGFVYFGVVLSKEESLVFCGRFF